MSTYGEQIRKVEQLLQRPMGCTMMDIIKCCNSTTPSRRISDLRDKGWIITKHRVSNRNFHRFFGNPPPKPEPVAVKTTWVGGTYPISEEHRKSDLAMASIISAGYVGIGG